MAGYRIPQHCTSAMVQNKASCIGTCRPCVLHGRTCSIRRAASRQSFKILINREQGHCHACPRYEQHLRAILGWPLGDSSLTVGAAIMLNVLGEVDGADGMRRAHRLMGRAYEVRSQCGCVRFKYYVVVLSVLSRAWMPARAHCFADVLASG